MMICLQVIFEDRSAGIVCYKDENGEIICEDYDEGPRLHHHQISRFTCNSRYQEYLVFKHTHTHTQVLSIPNTVCLFYFILFVIAEMLR